MTTAMGVYILASSTIKLSLLDPDPILKLLHHFRTCNEAC